MISAVIFDFDGVIVDSERLHWAAFNAVLEPRGKTILWPEYLATYIGFDDRDTFRTVFPQLGSPHRPAQGCPQDGQGLSLDQLIAEKATAFQRLLSEGGAAALPGAVELIRHLAPRLPIAICSGALKEDILPIIGKLGVGDAFRTIVTAEDTPVSKPDPAPYRLTKERLGIRDGLVIEDTPAGIASAKGAGLRVLAVTNSYEAAFLSEADAIVDTLEGLTLEELNQLTAV
jgi:beta-phosphoglucomutase